MDITVSPNELRTVRLHFRAAVPGAQTCLRQARATKVPVPNAQLTLTSSVFNDPRRPELSKIGLNPGLACLAAPRVPWCVVVHRPVVNFQ